MEIKFSYLLLLDLSLNLLQNSLCQCSLNDYYRGQRKYQLGPINKLLYLKRKASYITTSISLDIWCLQTSLYLIPVFDCLLGMDKSLLLLYFMEAPFTMMPLPVLSGFKIGYPQDPVKQSQVRSGLNNGFGSKRVLIYLTCIVTRVFFHLINYVWTVAININSNLSLQLEHSIRTQDQKEPFKKPFICQEPLQFTVPCIGQIMGSVTSPYGPFPSIIIYGCIISYQITVPVSQHQSCSPEIRLAVAILEYQTFGDVPFFCWTLNYKMIQRYQSGIVAIAQASSLVFQNITLH